MAKLKVKCEKGPSTVNEAGYTRKWGLCHDTLNASWWPVWPHAHTFPGFHSKRRTSHSKYTVGENVNQSGYCGKQGVEPSKTTKIRASVWSSSSSSEQGEMRSVCSLCSYQHCSQSRDGINISSPTHIWVGEEAGIQHPRVLSASKMKEILSVWHGEPEGHCSQWHESWGQIVHDLTSVWNLKKSKQAEGTTVVIRSWRGAGQMGPRV